MSKLQNRGIDKMKLEYTAWSYLSEQDKEKLLEWIIND